MFIFAALMFLLQSQVPRLELRPVTADRLTNPTYATHAGENSGRLFILEQNGRILMIPPGSASAVPFLDMTEKVLSGGERGLLGLAFHPAVAQNGRFFVHYTRRPDGAVVIAEYRTSDSNPDVADLRESAILTIPHPNNMHNGGMLEFGTDGFLYISIGDGGPAWDPSNRAQDINQLLGKVLRIDID